MTLDPRIDSHKFARLLKGLNSGEHIETRDAAGRALVKEIKRAGLWFEWSGDTDDIIEEALHFPMEMLETKPNMHFKAIAHECLHKGGITMLTERDREFLTSLQNYDALSFKQVEYLEGLTKRIGIVWERP